MSEMKTLKFPGDAEPREIVDAKAREDISKLSVPKPLTYDYMPEGYPRKTMQTTTLMEEQEVEFVFNSESSVYAGALPTGIEIAVGQTYRVNWDGTEYECVGESVLGGNASALGNLSILGIGDDTGEPFVYLYDNTETSGSFATLDTSASHTISVKTVGEVITPIAEEFLPTNTKNTTVFYLK